MNAILKVTIALALGWNTLAFAAEAFTLPLTPESPDAALATITHEAVWENASLEELTLADRLVVVSASVGDKLVLDPGFKVANVEVEDLWITDAEIARRGKGVVLHPTQVGVTRLFVADKDGWVLEYEIKVEGGIESAELAAYAVDETATASVVAEAQID